MLASESAGQKKVHAIGSEGQKKGIQWVCRKKKVHAIGSAGQKKCIKLSRRAEECSASNIFPSWNTNTHLIQRRN